MGYNDQIPWFATSNGVIDLKTSADFRDHRYTNNEISNETVNGSKNLNEQEKELVDKPASSKSQKTIKSLKVIAGGLPPLANKQRRSSSLLDNNDNTFNGPPVPKDNELYGDILVIPPIKQKPFEEYPRFEFSKVEPFQCTEFYICYFVTQACLTRMFIMIKYINVPILKIPPQTQDNLRK